MVDVNERGNSEKGGGPACRSCEHWCVNQAGGSGQCRRDPPVNHLVGDGGVVALWPVTQPDGWCSAWWPANPALATCESCRWSCFNDIEYPQAGWFCMRLGDPVLRPGVCHVWQLKQGGGT